jgi:signal transduction histidine kinase
MRIRTRLLLLVLAILVPAFLCAALGIAYSFHASQEFHRKTLRETARALSLVLERELARREAVLHTLAASPALDQGDLDTFYRHAAPIAATADVAIFLSTADGTQLLNTRLPYGAPLPRMLPVALEMRGRAEPKATIVSNLYQPPVGKGYSFAIQVPVVRDGQVRYYLNMGSDASQLQSLFDAQQLPPEWHAGIVDRDGIIVARSKDAQRYVGSPVRASLRAKLEAGEAFHAGTTLSGEQVLAFLGRATGSGWTFYVGVQEAVLQRAAVQTAAWMTAVACLLLGLALLAARLVANNTARAIEAARRAAVALGRGEPLVRTPHGLIELDTVDAALVEAGAKLRNAHAEQERRVAEAVTSAERSQRALLHAQKMEALGRLTGGIAHDFNNVLQTVSTGIELARRHTDDQQVRKALDTCTRAVIRATELSRQLAVFGRRQEARQETIDPALRLREVRPLLAGGLRSDIDLQMDVPSGLWPVTVDPLQFELALLNLAMNARDALPQGGAVRITAGNEHLELPLEDIAAGDYLRIKIADDGEGMAPDVLARAIDPFFTTKSVGSGSGMGLPQAYGFARQSGGTLVLQSEPGAGTEITLYLPRAVDSVAATGTQAQVPQRRADGETVLLVEDDPLVRDVVQPALEESGFSVLCADHGEQALRILESGQRIDIVFSDIVMPGTLSGIELAQAVRSDYPHIAILLATGYTEHAVDIPGVRLLAKPYDLAKAIGALLDATRR